MTEAKRLKQTEVGGLAELAKRASEASAEASLAWLRFAMAVTETQAARLPRGARAERPSAGAK
jgi:hypothetical protein